MELSALELAYLRIIAEIPRAPFMRHDRTTLETAQPNPNVPQMLVVPYVRTHRQRTLETN